MLSPGYDIIKTKSLVLRAFWGLYYLKRIPASGDGTEQGQVKEDNMKKRIFKFAALILAIVTCLAIASTVTTAASRATHSTTASSYSANGFAQSNTCHGNKVATAVRVKCEVFPITNPSAGDATHKSDIQWGDHQASVTLSNPNYGYRSSTAKHACYGKCDGCPANSSSYDWGSTESFH